LWLVEHGRAGWRERNPAVLVEVLFVLNLAALAALYWPRMAMALERANRRLLTRPRIGYGLLAALLLIWLGYLWSIARAMPYVGHADYADNAVVARNLAAGRGWVVDYVTQFYQLNPGGGVTRPQETWPLLQPVWIAAFFKLFGPQAWAAKLPNLIFLGLLAWGAYRIAERLWDRRIGLVAAALILLNPYFFRMSIFATTDLAFVAFSVGAIWLLFRAIERGDRRLLLGSGLLVGLMCLQKTSAVVIAGGMGLWTLRSWWRSGPELRWPKARVLALWWILPAALVFSPFVARNLIQFGKPVSSTESYDAWITGYQGAGAGDTEDIYKVMTTEGGLEGSNLKGLPEPSWVLRWGFQRSFDKLARQVAATRNYLLPALPWPAALKGKGEIMGVHDAAPPDTDPFRWLMAGSWLTLAGVWTLRRRQRRLLGLVIWSFAPYILFLVTYWHADEQRYFVPLVPWLALVAAAGIWSIHDTLAKAWRGKGAPLALAAALTLLVLAATPGWIEARDKTSQAPGSEWSNWQADIEAFDWIKANTPPGSVVMTRVPWQLNWHAERPAVMRPNTSDMPTLLRIARYYEARYLLVNATANDKDDAKIALGPLLRGQPADGFRLVHSIGGPQGRTLYLYQFPDDYNGAAPIR
ncbi:MAG TPA: glycosyltransferase family 39 protein, partial [Herpetosiphonaceae bacterium]